MGTVKNVPLSSKAVAFSISSLMSVTSGERSASYIFLGDHYCSSHVLDKAPQQMLPILLCSFKNKHFLATSQPPYHLLLHTS